MPFLTFNQGAIQTAYIGYKAYLDSDFDSTSDELQLFWPNTGQSILGQQPAAQFMDFVTIPLNTPTVYLPDAKQVSVGQNFIINNNGAEALILKMYDTEGEPPLASIDNGESYYFVLKDNSTSQGVWKSVNFGATMSAAIIAEIAGSGLQSNTLGTKLETTTIVTDIPEGTSSVDLLNTDRAQLLLWLSGTGAMRLTASTRVAGWYVLIRNQGTGQITIEGDEVGWLIDGEAAKTVDPLQSLILISDGTNYFSVGFGLQTSDLEIPITIADGGTGATTAPVALKNLMPADPETGNIVYYQSPNWVILPNPASLKMLVNADDGNLAWEDLQLPLSPATGSMVYYNGTSYVAITAGTEGQVLKWVGGVPTWSTP